jgi:hypothetical protein
MNGMAHRAEKWSRFYAPDDAPCKRRIQKWIPFFDPML